MASKKKNKSGSPEKGEPDIWDYKNYWSPEKIKERQDVRTKRNK
jgi:hypothetical protein